MCVFNVQCKSAPTRAKATKPNLNKARGSWITIGFMSVVLWNSLTPRSCCDRDLELPTNPGGLGVKGMWPASMQFSSVAQSCLTLCDPMDWSTPGLPVHHQLPEFAQTHVHWVSDAIQPSHPLSSPSPPAFNLSQHQGLSKWVSSLHHVAKGLELQLQHQFFQWIFRVDFLSDELVRSPCSPRDSQGSSPTPQFKSINSSVFSFLYSPTLLCASQSKTFECIHLVHI